MERLELKVPPDVLWLGVAGLMWLASTLGPTVVVAKPIRVTLAVLPCGVGIALIVAARRAFRSAGTTWLPSDPAGTTRLVTSGVFRFSRNPMYLGMLLVLLGLAFALSSPLALALTAPFVLYLNRFQIRPEERALSAAFGDGYRDYAERVRRWL